MKKALVLFVVLLFCFSGIASASLTDGLIADYPFNGNANDASGNGNNGTLHGGITLTTDRFGNSNSAYNFDGVDDYISVPDTPSLKPSYITLSAWIKPATLSANKEIISKYFGNGYYLRSAGGFIGFFAGNGDANAAISGGAWLHVVATFDGTYRKIYLNGILSSTNGPWVPHTMSNVSNPMAIGSFTGGGFNMYFNGVIDDIRMYNRALADSEVLQLYTANTPPPATPVGYNPTWLAITLMSLMGFGGFLLRRRAPQQ